MKKYGVLIGLTALLVLAVYVNIRVNKSAEAAALSKTPSPAPQGEVVVETAGEDGDFFATFRDDRENNRAKELEYLETIISEQTDVETLADAQEQKLDMVSSMETEFTVESLLKAKGFSDAAVMFHKGSVNVILKAEDNLTSQQAAQVLDIVCRETGESAQNVKISTVK